MNRRRIVFSLVLLVFFAAAATLNFSIISRLRRPQASAPQVLQAFPSKVSIEKAMSPSAASHPQPPPLQPLAATAPPTTPASTCIRPEDTTQGLDSIFKRDPSFWGRRPRLVQALKDYAALHKRALSEDGPVVLSHSWGGMNNRFLPLASALLFGMMTGR